MMLFSVGGPVFFGKIFLALQLMFVSKVVQLFLLAFQIRSKINIQYQMRNMFLKFAY